MLESIILSVVAFCLSACGVALFRRWAESREVLDVPNERSSHTRPTPLGGGLAIVVVVLIVWLAGGWRAFTYGPLLPYVAGALLIAGVSWLDDLHPIATPIRFLVHGVGAILAILSFGYWHTTSIPVFHQLSLGWLGLPITFLWIVGLTNAYNFMDGIDGIAGLQAVVVGIGWFILGSVSQQPHVSMMGLLLAGASLGFLIHNWPPAKVFMGDVGSAFLGYTFAALPLMAAHAPPANARLALAGALLLWPFIFDSAFTFVRRAMRAENVFSAHRSHLYQRLILTGRSHLWVTTLYAVLSLSGTGLALIWLKGMSAGQAAIIVVLPLLCLGLWGYVVRRERKLEIGKASTQVAILSEQ